MSPLNFEIKNMKNKNDIYVVFICEVHIIIITFYCQYVLYSEIYKFYIQLLKEYKKTFIYYTYDT